MKNRSLDIEFENFKIQEETQSENLQEDDAQIVQKENINNQDLTFTFEPTIETTNNSNLIEKPRLIYLDILRSLSIFAVIIIHSVAIKTSDMSSLGTPSWWWANSLNGFIRWAIPIFFMISGALTLGNKNVDNIPKFIKSRLLKIGIPFLIWSAIYTIFTQVYFLKQQIEFPNILLKILTNIILDQSYYHLWFVYDIFIIYLITPLIRKIVINSTKKELEYFLGLWFVATIIYTLIQQIMPLVGSGNTYHIRILYLTFPAGLLGYYVLGYYLNLYDFSKKVRISLYITALLCVPITIFGTYFLTLRGNALNESLYSHFSVTTFFTSIAFFIFMKNVKWEQKLTKNFQKLIVILSNATFGIYLIHMLFIIYFNNKLSFMLPTSYILFSTSIIILTYVFSFFFSKLIQLIPRIGKYII